VVTRRWAQHSLTSAAGAQEQQQHYQQQQQADASITLKCRHGRCRCCCCHWCRWYLPHCIKGGQDDRSVVCKAFLEGGGV